MFAHRSCVIPFTKITMFPYSEQVQDIEHYGASVGDDLGAKWTSSSKLKGFYELLVHWALRWNFGIWYWC